MKIKDMWHKAFISGDWYVGYRAISKNAEAFEIIENRKNTWIADPFVFEYKGEHYLFVEMIENKKGVIAYYKFIDDKPVYQEIVLRENYHLSYPCIFEYQGEVYMIPESADNHSIDLYKAVEFPNRWQKVAKLAEGIFLDSTVFCYDEKYYLLTYEYNNGKYELSMWNLDIDAGVVQKKDMVEYRSNIARPAGSVVEEDGILYRPAQNCSRMYGEEIIWYKIDGLKQGRYKEEKDHCTRANDLCGEFQRTHTYNRDSKYEVVDFFKEKFSLTRPAKLILKKAKQKIGQ